MAAGSTGRIFVHPSDRASKGTEIGRCPSANHATSARSPCCFAHPRRCLRWLL